MIARLLVALSLVAAVAAPAHAVGDKRAAAAHFQKGRTLFDAGSFAAALEEFQQGYDAFPLPGFLVNIGQCQRKLDRLDEAAAAFQHFLDSDPSDPKLRAEVQEALAEVNGERERRASLEAEAKRQRDEAERRHPDDEPARAAPDLRPALPPSALPSIAGVSAPASPPAATLEEHPQKSKKWVWAVVSVLAIGAAASAVAVAVVETQPAPARPGSLGLLDGRR